MERRYEIHTYKKCKHEYICKTNWIFAGADGDKRSKKYNRFPIHGRLKTN